MGLGIASLYNRFSRWAEQQPQKKLEKLYAEISRDHGYFSYIRDQEAFAWRVKSIAKDGATFTARELLAAVKQESRALSMFSRDEPKVVQALLAVGVVPDAACFDAAYRGGLACFRAQLDGIEKPSAAVMKYALSCHGNDKALIDGLFARNPALTQDVLTAAVVSNRLPEAERAGIIKTIIAAGVRPTAKALEHAVYNEREDIAISLLDAGAPATIQAMVYAVEGGLQSIVEKLHEKGCSFDETLAKCPRELQVQVKAYRKMITGEGDADAEIAELKELVKELTARLEKIEGGATPKAKAPAAAKPAAKA